MRACSVTDVPVRRSPPRMPVTRSPSPITMASYIGPPLLAPDLLQQLHEVRFPDRGQRVRSVPARPVARGNENVPAALHTRHESLHEPELGWIHEIVGGVDRDDGCLDLLERARGVVVPG